MVGLQELFQDTRLKEETLKTIIVEFEECIENATKVMDLEVLREAHYYCALFNAQLASIFHHLIISAEDEDEIDQLNQFKLQFDK